MAQFVIADGEIGTYALTNGTLWAGGQQILGEAGTLAAGAYTVRFSSRAEAIGIVAPTPTSNDVGITVLDPLDPPTGSFLLTIAATPPPDAAVPEPGSIALDTLGVAALVRRRRGA